MMTEVEMIMDKLKEKQYNTPEQFRALAHVIQMKKYESYEDPPDKLFFGKSRKKTLSTDMQAVVSPGKRLSMQSECIDQLDKWHKLMEPLLPEHDECYSYPRSKWTFHQERDAYWGLNCL